VAGAEQLIITVRGPADAPKVLLNQEEIAGGVGGVEDRIKELMKGRREKVVFFQAENELPYQYVVAVMDKIRGGGAEKIGLITDETLGLAPAGASGQ
jgi:biopolymer transport protein ExbD